MSKPTAISSRTRFSALRRFHIDHGPTDLVAIFFSPQPDQAERAADTAQSPEAVNPDRKSKASIVETCRHGVAIEAVAEGDHSEDRSVGAGSDKRPRLEDKCELERPSLIDLAIGPLIDGGRCYSQGTCERGCVPAVRGNSLCFCNRWRRHATYVSTLILIVQARYHVAAISWLTCL